MFLLTKVKTLKLSFRFNSVCYAELELCEIKIQKLIRKFELFSKIPEIQNSKLSNGLEAPESGEGLNLVDQVNLSASIEQVNLDSWPDSDENLPWATRNPAGSASSCILFYSSFPSLFNYSCFPNSTILSFPFQPSFPFLAFTIHPSFPSFFISSIIFYLLYPFLNYFISISSFFNFFIQYLIFLLLFYFVIL